MAVKTTRKKLWHLRYQRPATKQRIMMGLGAFPALSLSDARRLRADYLSLLANGNDPKTQPEQVTEQQQISVDPKYRDTYSTHIPAVILVVNNNPMRFTDRSGGVTRRRVILHFPEIVSASERDPQLKEKIRRELAVIVRHLMQRFSQPQDARTLLQSQQNSGEAMRIKRDADPLVDFCGYLFTTPEPNALYMGNASIRPVQPKRYLYHAYLTYMEANGYINPLSMKMFGLSLDGILREYGLNYLKRRTKLGIQTNLDLSDESSADWLPKCDQLTI